MCPNCESTEFEEFFPADGTSVDCIAAKAMRHAYPNAARIARETVSQPQNAASDAISGVPRHSEVSEAPKAPQEPIHRRCDCERGHPIDICAECGEDWPCEEAR